MMKNRDCPRRGPPLHPRPGTLTVTSRRPGCKQHQTVECDTAHTRARTHTHTHTRMHTRTVHSLGPTGRLNEGKILSHMLCCTSILLFTCCFVVHTCFVVLPTPRADLGHREVHRVPVAQWVKGSGIVSAMARVRSLAPGNF